MKLYKITTTIEQSPEIKTQTTEKKIHIGNETKSVFISMNLKELVDLIEFFFVVICM
jgi:hypothetical protein